MPVCFGGYYAPRGAAFEKADQGVLCVGSGMGLRRHLAAQMGHEVEDDSDALLAAAVGDGHDTMEEALVRVRAYTLDDAIPQLAQPLLIVHGDHDTAFPVSDAEAAFAAAGSKDKALRIFSAGEGGAQHVNADDPDPVRQLIVDWFAQHLGTLAGPCA